MKISKALALAGAFCAANAKAVTNATLSSLARDIERVESVREIKDTMRQFSQLAQFGRYDEISSLFSSTGVLNWGNASVSDAKAIGTWFKKDAGDMNGVNAGSLDTIVAENPLVNLSPDGKNAKGRWNGLRFQGDGKGGTRIQGGIYENEFVLEKDGWKFSLLKYYAMYEGPYAGGWRNVGGQGIPIIPYHFDPSSAGVPIPEAVGETPLGNVTAEELAMRATRLTDEDQVRNLQHAYGYYVDRRMWTDASHLFAENSTVTVNGVSTNGLRNFLHKMGPDGLTRGILNDRPIFDSIVDVAPNGKEAVARGFEIGMLGDANTHAASWEFNVFRNTFVKQDGVWKFKSLSITQLIKADYYTGWGSGGTLSAPSNRTAPPFLDIRRRGSLKLNSYRKSENLTEIQRTIARAAAYDGVENISAAYGYYLDDLQCKEMAALHASAGHKASPFTGFYRTPARIQKACETSYGVNRTGLRSSISFHWRPQSVILVSDDGRSATLRARLLQPSTSKDKAGAFNGAIYHDQMVLEDGKWKLWSVTIDEFYWQSTSWAAGWANPSPSNSSTPSNSSESSLAKKFPPDLSIRDVGDREATFGGGAGPVIQWPDIQKMWFQYRNLVSGWAPTNYWPGCVPCKVKKEWSLEANGYVEPPTGPKDEWYGNDP